MLTAVCWVVYVALWFCLISGCDLCLIVICAFVWLDFVRFVVGDFVGGWM